MGDFFKSGKFKILMALFVMIFFFALNASRTDGLAPFTSRVLSYVTMPLQKVSTFLSTSVGGYFSDLINAQNIAEENELLHERIDELNQKIVKFDEYERENEYLRDFLDIKEQNPTLDFEPAMVIARDASDRFFSFTIDKGSANGIELRDTVITSGGLVGVVSELGDIYSKVITILDTSLEISAISSSSRDIGVVSGSVELSLEGLCEFSMLDRETSLAEGDLVLTSGYGGLYPRGLVVGQVTEVKSEESGISKYAIIKPSTDIRDVTDVLVIKDFEYEEE